jgi:predicted DNA-binding protein with PD1-like motif
VIVAESRRGRRLVGRLDRGADILEGFAEVCRVKNVRTGELRAFGSVEQVVMAEYDQRARSWRPHRRFDAQFDILNLTGNLSERDGKLSVRAHVTLSRERDNGIEVVGGFVVAARVFAVEFVIDCFDDVILRRTVDAQTGLPLWREAIALGDDAVPEPIAVERTPPPMPAFEAPARTVAVVPEPTATATPAWREVVAASSAAGEPDDAPAFDADARVAPGDWIEHPKFGRCQVERVEGDYEFVSARLRNQRLIRLSLDVVSLEPMGQEGSQQLFRVVLPR